MEPLEHVTIAISTDLAENIDRFDPNRSVFIRTAVEREVARRNREDLLRSLRDPHPDTVDFVDEGFSDWCASLPAEDEGLLELDSGTPVRWDPEGGWIEEPA
jgi:hypothetical protein